jgi:uncharacterized membrane protein (DUF2068 family)
MDKHPKGFFVRHFGVRGVALFEAGKGALAVLASIWLMTLRHKDMKDVTETVLEEMRRVVHINPDRPLFQSMIRSAGGITPKGLRIFALLILAYAVLRFVEAGGLWLEKEWAEWLALITGAVYTPVFAYEFIRHPTGFRLLALVLNLLVVAYLAWLLRDLYHRKHAVHQAESQERSP